MREKCTEGMLKTMQLAGAIADNFNHEAMGTESMLLALLDVEGSHLKIIEKSGATIEGVRSAVMSRIVRGSEKKMPEDLRRMTAHAAEAFRNAMNESAKLLQDLVGTEHLLLGILEEPEGIAVDALNAAGLHLQNVREEMFEERLGQLQAQNSANAA